MSCSIVIQVKIDNVVLLVRDVCAEVLSHNALPGRVEVLVEVLLEVLGKCRHFLEILLAVVTIDPHLHELNGLQLHV